MPAWWAVAVAICVLGTPTRSQTDTFGGLGEEELPLLQGYQCQQPRKSEIYTLEGRCRSTPRDRGQNREAVLIQRLSERRAKGWLCRATVTTNVHYCGFASYTQALPLSTTAQHRTTSLAECRHWVHGKTVRHPAGGLHTIAVPGISSFSVQLAGEEKIANGVMTCTGTDTTYLGKFLKKVLIQEEWNVEVFPEDFIVADNRVEAVTNREMIACAAPTGGCAGATTTFFWELTNGGCNLAKIRPVTGVLVGELLKSDDRLLAFNLTGGQTVVPEDCPDQGRVLARTQFARVFITWGRWDEVKLPRVTGQDVDLGLQISALEAWLEWKQEEEEAIADLAHKRVMCQMEGNRLEENQMLPTGGGRFAARSWDAIVEMECVETVVKYRPTPGECFIDIPVDGDLPFLDSKVRTLRLDSEKIACADIHDRFLKDVKGNWWRVGKQVSRTVKPREARPLAGEVHGHPLDRHVGLYTAAELEQFHKAQVIPRAKQQVLNQLIGGLCATSEDCPITSLEGAPRYSLEKLEARLADTVESLTPSWLTAIHWLWGASEPVGRLGGLIFVLYLALWIAVAVVNRGRQYLRRCWRQMPLDYVTEDDQHRRRRQGEILVMEPLNREDKENSQSSSPLQSRGGCRNIQERQ